MAVAITELGCVAAMLFLDRRVRVLATYILLVLMVGIQYPIPFLSVSRFHSTMTCVHFSTFQVGALYTHFMIGDTLKEAGGAIFGLTMVLIRLYTMGKLEIKLRLD